MSEKLVLDGDEDDKYAIIGKEICDLLEKHGYVMKKGAAGKGPAPVPLTGEKLYGK